MEEQEKDNWKAAREHVEKYLATLLDLYKLKFTEKSALLGASFLSSFLVYLVLLFFVLFISITLSVLIGECLGHLYLGFAALSLFYLLLFILLTAKRKRWIKLRLVNYLIKKIYEQ